MYKKIISLLAAFSISTASVYADFSVKLTEQGVCINGTDNHNGKHISAAIYNQSDKLLYADQTECTDEGGFSFMAGVSTDSPLRIKIGSNGMYSPDMLISDTQTENQVLYVSKYAKGGDGTQEKPYATLDEAYKTAQDGAAIKILDRADWDIVQAGQKHITVFGGVLNMKNIQRIEIPLKLEQITIEAEEGQNIATADIEIENNVKFTNPVNLNTQCAYIRSGAYKSVTGEEIHLFNGISNIQKVQGSALIFENNAVYNSMESICDYKIHCSDGGSARLTENGIELIPEDGRVINLDGVYTKETNLTNAGEYNVSFEYDFKLHMAQICTKNGETVVSVDLSAYNREADEKKESSLLMAAVYDTNKCLTGLAKLPIKTGEMNHYDLPLGDIDSENSTVKLFLWDSLSKMIPLCEMISDVKPENKEQNIYYVAPYGREDGNGSFANPFKTLQEAVSAADSSEQPTTIYLRGGIHSVNEQIVMNESNKNIIIEPYGKEKAVITTGYRIYGNNFAKADDDISRRVLYADARENLMCVSLEDIGIDNIGEICEYSGMEDAAVMPSLTQNGSRMQLCAYPDTGYINFGNNVSGGDGSSPMQFNVGKDKIPNALSWQGNEIYADGYIRADWIDSRCKVKINEDGSDYIVTAQNEKLEINPLEGRRVRFLNVIEELSAPGEWYLDRESKKLYIYPYPGFDEQSIITFNPRHKNMGSVFKLYNTKQISFKNIEFANVGTKVFDIEKSSNISVENCKISDILETVLQAKESTYISIIGNTVKDTSSSVISIGGGDTANLIKANNYISDNDISRFALDSRICNPAVQIFGYGTTVRRNKIYDTPHMAIGISGMGVTIEYNEIYNVCNETADAGAIYSGQYPHLQENVIRYNYFHDIRNRTGLGFSVNTVYFDDLGGSFDVYSNIFYNVEQGSLVGGGRSNRFWSNAFIDCDKSVVIDSRGAKTENYEDNRAYVNLYWSPYRSELWKKEFPLLYSIMEDEPKLPKYNKIIKNAYINTASEILYDEAASLTEHSGNITLTTEEAGFWDYENHNFSLRENSKIYQKIEGFYLPKASEIGIQSNPGV